MSSEAENAKDNTKIQVSDTPENTAKDDGASKDSLDSKQAVKADKEVKNEKDNAKADKSSSVDSNSVASKEQKEAQEIKKESDEDDDDHKNKNDKEKVSENSANNKTNKEDDDENDKEEDEGDEKVTTKNDQKKGIPLLDQPLEQSGTRERKKVQRFNEDFPAEIKEAKTNIPVGTGTQLGEIPRIDASISRFKNDDLKLLHRLLYKTPGKTALITKNIKKFNGFDFKKDTEEYNKKIESTRKFELKQLKSICEMLDLEKKGAKDEIVDRIIEFLLEPKDSGKPVGGGRPKRTAAVRANNRGYSSHDDSYSSDERRTSRGGRGKGKRSNLKDDTTSDSDSEFHPSDASEGRPRVVKRNRVGRKKRDSDEDEEKEDASDLESPTSEESEDEPKKRKRSSKRTTGSATATNNKVKNKTTAPATRGRKPAAESEKKTSPAKKVSRKKDHDSSEESEQHEEDNASSSEDEPLLKKAKSPQPPTDDEIKQYVKQILDGANLEEITMKTVCKQVYAHYPEFDLAHKKDFIKSTVKSLIST